MTMNGIWTCFLLLRSDVTHPITDRAIDEAVITRTRPLAQWWPGRSVPSSSRSVWTRQMKMGDIEDSSAGHGTPDHWRYKERSWWRIQRCRAPWRSCPWCRASCRLQWSSSKGRVWRAQSATVLVHMQRRNSSTRGWGSSSAGDYDLRSSPSASSSSVSSCFREASALHRDVCSSPFSS